MSDQQTMKPMMIIPPGLMSDANVKLLRDNGICVAIAKDPSKIKFLDPIPCTSSQTQMERAAIRLSRLVLNGHWNQQWRSTLGKAEFAELYVDLLVKGTSLDVRGSVEEQEQKIIDDARHIELVTIGREEARAKRLSNKQADTKESP